jgi:hypothetical protein
MRAHSNGDRIGGTGVDMDLAPVRFRDDVAVKNIILQFDDLHADDAGIEN